MNENQQTSHVLLPTTESGLDALIARIVELVNAQGVELKNDDDAQDAVATMIMHLGHTTAHVQETHFTSGIIKSLANRAAYAKLQSLAQKRKAAEEEKKLKLVEKESEPALGEPLQNA